MSSTLTDRIVATYRIETPDGVMKAAEVLAGEQSSGTFVAVPGETPELAARFRARVERVTPLEDVSEPSLSGSRSAIGPFHRAEIVVSWSLENVGTNLPTLVSTIQGNLYELREFSGLKLLDVELPRAFAEAYPGPRFGIRGTRELTGVREGPIIGTIIKPSVGLTPEATAALVDELASAGIDFIKDDELMADPPHSPLAKRVEAVMRVIHRHADRSGKKVMFAFNITDSIDAMRRHHDAVFAAGGTCVMVSLNSVGLPAVEHLRRYCELPIHGHRNGWGMYSRHPFLGIEFRAYQKLWRLAGVDHLHVNAFDNKFWEPNDSVLRSLEACLEPLFGGYHVMPVLSSGQWGGQAPDTYRASMTTDVMYLAGGGIMAHPDGPAAGLRSIRQAWDAAVRGIPLDEHAREHRELARSIEMFGKPSAKKSPEGSRP
jgi:ribulose-bisphosphate carboxylase large chain